MTASPTQDAPPVRSVNVMRLRGSRRIGDPGLASHLRRAIQGEVLFDPFSRGRYSTDASIYQIEPIGAVVPRTKEDVAAIIDIARAEGVPVLPRGAGTSQAGQTVGEAVVVDTSKHLRRILAVDPTTRTAVVEPGVVLDDLNRHLRPHGLWFPVDVSTSSRATLGGMAANNSCGTRSIRYGIMVDNVAAIDAILADGTACTFNDTPGNLASQTPARYAELVQRLRAVAAREADAIADGFPKLLRRVGGYNIETIDPAGHNMARMLVGSEGTLAFFTRLHLKLAPIPPHRVMGVCHFSSFRAAMEAAPEIVGLDPTAVELVDRTMIGLARAIPLFRRTIEEFVIGDPAALLLVEFSGEAFDPLKSKLAELRDLMKEPVVEARDPALQTEITEVRKAGLNIMMSMKGAGKPVSFIEDCAVPLADLADYTDGINELFARHGVAGTWYAHASVGCLHVRPVLDMKDEGDIRKMREIAERAFDLVRTYKGSHSGEHGDGLVRSEFHERMFGPRLVRAFEEVKDAFDPDGLLNPGKIVRAPRMDDRDLFRYPPGYRAPSEPASLDWSPWGGFLGAVEMCNNNGACRKAAPGVMCPSYRATLDEQHSTRGRANTLRLALSGQLGPDALRSDALAETLDLCIGCKACRRECPTGVDMARMKMEVLQQRASPSVRDRLIAHLPRYAPVAARLAPIVNGVERIAPLRKTRERVLGFTAHRPLPAWHRHPWRDPPNGSGETTDRDVVLFVDCFNRWFEPENARAAARVLQAAGYRPLGTGNGRPLCCGRTYLGHGMLDEARAEAERTLAALTAPLAAGTPIIGLEPSCLLTFRDELPVLVKDEAARTLAKRAMLLEEFLTAEKLAGRLDLPLSPVPTKKAFLHGHCHQKSFDVMPAIRETLALVPDLEVETIEAGCCGMAGSFGYEAEHFEISLKIGDAGPLPQIRAAPADALIVADGTSCRTQFRDMCGREAAHVAAVLDQALARPR